MRLNIHNHKYLQLSEAGNNNMANNLRNVLDGQSFQTKAFNTPLINSVCKTTNEDTQI